MHWIQDYNPLNNTFLSALVAAIPIIFFILALTVFKIKGIWSALITLIISAFIAVFVYHMPFTKALASILYGFGAGLWPIGYIVIMAVWLYKISLKSGKFNIIRSSIASITNDQRLQLLLIGFCFNGFLEGAAGFGVPIAISAALLTELGFNPLKAASLCLIANASSGAFGAIGIPVIVGAQVGGLDPKVLSKELVYLLPLITFIIPFLLVLIVDKFKGVKETFPAIFVVSGVYAFVQLITMWFIGPELVNILAALITMAVLAVFLRFWKPKNIFRLDGQAGNVKTDTVKHSFKEILSAWSPFIYLTIAVILWSLPAFKKLFLPGGLLNFSTLLYHVPFLDKQVMKVPPISKMEIPYEAVFKLDIISATGTAILLAVIVTIMFNKSVTVSKGFEAFKETVKELYIPVMTICFVLGFAYIANYSGLSSSMGLALAKTGKIFPVFSPLLGWIGVFITGSVVSNNALFGNLQVVTGTQIHVSSALLLASNTSGGVVAKLISPQSIAIATASVKQTGQESALFKMTVRYSLGLLLIISIMTYSLSLILS